MQTDIYTMVMVISTVLASLLIISVKNSPSFAGKRPFIWLLALIASWCFYAAMELASHTMVDELFWSKLNFASSMFLGIVYLWFVMEFSRVSPRTIRLWLYILGIIPFASMITGLTNNIHHLIWKTYLYDGINNSIVIEYGVCYWIILGIQLLMVVVGMVLLYLKGKVHKTSLGLTTWILMDATLLPILASIIYMSNVTQLRVIPLSVFLSVVLIFFGYIRLRMFDLVPIARHKLLDVMREAMFVLDADYRLRDYNQNAASQFNVKTSDISRDICELIPELSFVKEISFRDRDLNHKIHFTALDKWLETTVTALGTVENIGLLIIMRDITSHKQYESMLIKLNQQISDSHAQLRLLNDQKNKLFSIIAHDLKNPFHQILGYAKVLVEYGKNLTPEEIDDTSRTLLESAIHGKYILDDLLTWSRSLMKTIPFNPEKLDPYAEINLVVQSMQSLAKKKEISFEATTQEGFSLNADRNMLSVVLRNLIGNAIKFSYPKSKIIIKAAIEQELCRISVSDSGMGIEPEKLEKLFSLEPKVSTHGTSGEPGTGLGLNICKEFTETNGGMLSAESDPGKGSTFSFTVPLWQD